MHFVNFSNKRDEFSIVQGYVSYCYCIIHDNSCWSCVQAIVIHQVIMSTWYKTFQWRKYFTRSKHASIAFTLCFLGGRLPPFGYYLGQKTRGLVVSQPCHSPSLVLLLPSLSARFGSENFQSHSVHLDLKESCLGLWRQGWLCKDRVHWRSAWSLVFRSR